MNREPFSPPVGYRLPDYVRKSFAAEPIWQRLSGHGGLVRFYQRGKVNREGRALPESKKDGWFWFNELLFSQTRERAKRELHAQFRNGPPQGASFRALTGAYLRICLRQDLAICHDWTEDFDGYAILPLRPGDSIAAATGPIRAQPAYSLDHADHPLAESKDIRLPGEAEQFAIDFTLRENRWITPRILGPFPF